MCHMNKLDPVRYEMMKLCHVYGVGIVQQWYLAVLSQYKVVLLFSS